MSDIRDRLDDLLLLGEGPEIVHDTRSVPRVGESLRLIAVPTAKRWRSSFLREGSAIPRSCGDQVPAIVVMVPVQFIRPWRLVLCGPAAAMQTVA